LALSNTPLTAPSGAAPPPIELDTALIDRTLGAKGKLNGGVYQVSLKRAGTIADAGMAVPDAMGTVEAINFQPTGDGKAAIAGDFVLPPMKSIRCFVFCATTASRSRPCTITCSMTSRVCSSCTSGQTMNWQNWRQD
jgi:hypothetical protein